MTGSGCFVFGFSKKVPKMKELYGFGSTDGPREKPVVERVRPIGAASDKKRRQALELFERGFGYKAVADMLALSVNTVRDWSRLHKQGRFSPNMSRSQYRYTAETKQLALGLRERGYSWREIEAETGVNASTCRAWVRAAAVKDG